MDYYMVEIFESSSMTFNSSWAAIIVRMAEIISNKIFLIRTFYETLLEKNILNYPFYLEIISNCV